MQPDELTPIEQHGNVWLKRDDLFEYNGCAGGKVRTCLMLAMKAKERGIEGLTTAVSRDSPQGKIVATVARSLGMRARCHIPKVKVLWDKIAKAQELGAELIPHQPCYNTALRAWSKQDADRLKWFDIPFGMESEEAISQNANQVRNVPRSVSRIVIPVGSGITAAGVLHGLQRFSVDVPVLGVAVGANREKTLDKWAPLFGWRRMMTLIHAPEDYHDPVDVSIGGIKLDEIYEAKAARYLRPNDLLWIVGTR
ncbi:MAG TPA: pyridoxal-phosphate dependent enzyme [Candidatus Sulfotelmatobacter sp.]|jgi:1-aminocyclopropane-1-carboxylate deaminase/D-cysteine desulfhydrase-like pyridoxal-dependent ACC family enzyme